MRYSTKNWWHIKKLTKPDRARDRPQDTAMYQFGKKAKIDICQVPSEAYDGHYGFEFEEDEEDMG